MPDVSVTYSEVQAVSTRLTGVAADTLPKLSQLQTQVNALLDPSGGLWLHLSSPVLKDKYTAFNTSVNQAVQQIPSWAHQFTNITSQIDALDKAIVASSN